MNTNIPIRFKLTKYESSNPNRLNNQQIPKPTSKATKNKKASDSQEIKSSIIRPNITSYNAFNKSSRKQMLNSCDNPNFKFDKNEIIENVKAKLPFINSTNYKDKKTRISLNKTKNLSQMNIFKTSKAKDIPSDDISDDNLREKMLMKIENNINYNINFDNQEREGLYSEIVEALSSRQTPSKHRILSVKPRVENSTTDAETKQRSTSQINHIPSGQSHRKSLTQFSKDSSAIYHQNELESPEEIHFIYVNLNKQSKFLVSRFEESNPDCNNARISQGY